MIKKFFLCLTQNNIKHLLISGQATVLYGAATFSEDIDLWVSPELENWQKFIDCLHKLKAKIYKATPPLSPEFIQNGHAYHFEFSPIGGESVWFLDVMGVVPRVGTFSASYKNVNFHKTEWGRLAVVGLRDLVQIKKTRRLADYPIISNLVRQEYEKMRTTCVKGEDWIWILTNSFETEDILFYLKNHQGARKACKSLSRECLKYALQLIEVSSKQKNDLYSVSNAIALEIERIRQEDRVYWQTIIAELKALNRRGKLSRVGSVPIWAP